MKLITYEQGKGKAKVKLAHLI